MPRPDGGLWLSRRTGLALAGISTWPRPLAAAGDQHAALGVAADAAQIARTIHADAEATISQLFSEYAPKLMRYVLARGKSGEPAEDAIQDTFITVAKQWDTFVEVGNPGGYLTTAFARRLIDAHRARLRQRPTATFSDENMPDFGKAGSAEESVLRAEAVRVLLDVVNELPAIAHHVGEFALDG